jgi:hypothetical protein
MLNPNNKTLNTLQLLVKSINSRSIPLSLKLLHQLNNPLLLSLYQKLPVIENLYFKVYTKVQITNSSYAQLPLNEQYLTTSDPFDNVIVITVIRSNYTLYS